MVQELWAEAARVPGVAYVTKLLFGDEVGKPIEDIIQMNGLDNASQNIDKFQDNRQIYHRKYWW